MPRFAVHYVVHLEADLSDAPRPRRRVLTEPTIEDAEATFIEARRMVNDELDHSDGLPYIGRIERIVPADQ